MQLWVDRTPQGLGVGKLQDMDAVMEGSERLRVVPQGQETEGYVELGVGVCEDTELECQMRLVEEMIEQREARNCRHSDRYVRTVVGTWRIEIHSFVDRAVGVESDGGLVAWFHWWDSVVVSW